MLRITVNENPQTITLRLEGRLSSGAWLDELGECWRRTTESEHEPMVRVDLSEVTFIDAAGKASLADMHRKGAELVATDCLTKAIVAEITVLTLPFECAVGQELAETDPRTVRR